MPLYAFFRYEKRTSGNFLCMWVMQTWFERLFKAHGVSGPLRSALFSLCALLYDHRAVWLILPLPLFSTLHPFLQTLSLFLVVQTFPASGLLGNGHLNDVSRARRDARLWCQDTHSHDQESVLLLMSYCSGNDISFISHLACLLLFSFFLCTTPPPHAHFSWFSTIVYLVVSLCLCDSVAMWQNPISAAESATGPICLFMETF